MKLTFSERINLGSMLPVEGNWITLTAARSIQSLIMVKDTDLKDVEGIVNPDGTVQYNTKKDADSAKDYDFSAVQTGVIKEQLERMEKAGKLPSFTMSLYEKFVIGPVA